MTSAPPIALVLGGMLVAATAPGAGAAAVRFVDVAAVLGVDVVPLTGDGANDYILEANGNGAAVLDYDGDGDRDLLIVSGSTLARLRAAGGDRIATLYRNDGAAGFRDATAAAGLVASGWGMGVCVGDVDANGSPDVYLTAYGPNRLLLNLGDGSFRDAAAAAGVADESWSHGCAFGDYDGDGDLDLYVANYVAFDEGTIEARGPTTRCGYMGNRTFCGPLGLTAQADRLYRNAGDGTFEQVVPAGLAGLRPSFGLGVVFSDLDGDGWLDLFVSNDSEANFLLRNLGDGTFEETALLAGLAFNERGDAQASMGIAVGDYDNDGDLDLFVTNFSQDYNTLYRNHGGFFADVSTPAGVALPSMNLLGWGTLFVDVDHDGWRDLFVANGHVFDDVAEFDIGSAYAQPKQLFRNLGDGRFAEVSGELGADLLTPKASRGAAAGDLDGDGDLDLVTVNVNQAAQVLRNDGGSERPWLAVELRPAPGAAEPIGARVVLAAGGLTQMVELTGGGSYLSHGDRVAHFGLAGAQRAERLEIRWPGGIRRALTTLPGSKLYVVPGPVQRP